MSNRRFNLHRFLDQLERNAFRIAGSIIILSWIANHLWHELIATWPAIERLSMFHWP